MIKRNRILIGVSAALMTGAVVAVPVAIVQTQGVSAVGSTSQTTSSANEIPPEDTPRSYYAATALNSAPGPLTDQKDLVPPAPPVFTDTGTLSFGAKTLPIPLLPVPEAGYAAWSTNVTYVLEGTNEPVTNATLPTLAAGTVVLAAALAKPADGHTGPAYAGTVRFVIQRLKVVKPAASTLQSSAYSVLTSLYDGILPAQGLTSFVPPGLEQNGYLPWSQANRTQFYTDSSGKTYSLDTAADWAAMVARFKNAQGDTLFTVSYVWTTAPDKNHYVSLGEDQTVSYEYSVYVQKQTTIATTTAVGTPAVKHAAFFFQGEQAEVTTMNQFATFAYSVKRSENGAPSGAIVPQKLPQPELHTLATDGVTYQTLISGDSKVVGPIFKNPVFTEIESAGINKKANYTGQSDYWKGTEYVSQQMNLNQIDIPGSDFSISEKIPADSAVAATPLVALRYAAKDATAAVRLITQLRINYSFVNDTYLDSPEVFTDPALASLIPTVGDMQRYLVAPYVYNADFDDDWKDKTGYVKPSPGSDIRYDVNGNYFYPYSLMTSKQLWYRTYDLKSDKVKIPNELDFLPLTLNSNAAVLGSATWNHGYTSFSRANGNTDSFDLAGFDATQIVAGQFFDVASLNFVPAWDAYPTEQKRIIRANLFDPDTTRLKVGAYVQYKDGSLSFYLIPYISSLPKVNFANSSATAIPVNRDLGFSYQFQNVSVSLDRFNDTRGGY